MVHSSRCQGKDLIITFDRPAKIPIPLKVIARLRPELLTYVTAPEIDRDSCTYVQQLSSWR